MKTAAKPKKPKPAKTWDPIPGGVTLLAIDCSSSAIGWAMLFDGAVRNFGLIKSPASWESADRIAANTARLSELVWGEQHSLWVIAEWQSHLASGGFHAQGLAILGQSQGSAWQMLRTHLYVDRVERVSERVWTKINGRNVSKDSRLPVARQFCPGYDAMLAENPKFDNGLDIADAIGIGRWRLMVGGSPCQ